MHEQRYELDELDTKPIKRELKYQNSLDDALVVISNLIARATTKWSLEETKMFLCAVSQIKTRDAQNWVTISKTDLAEKLNIDATNKPKMREMFRKMVEKSFVNFDGESEHDWMSGVLLISMKSTKKDISIQFNPNYITQLDQLSSHFTEFYLEYVMDFKHLASYKLYVYLVSWAKYIIGEPEREIIPKNKIHQIFGLKESDYWRDYGKENARFHFADFEKYCLNPAIKEINELKSCDMHILSCEKKKKGKFVLGYEVEYCFVNEEGQRNEGYIK